MAKNNRNNKNKPQAPQVKPAEIPAPEPDLKAKEDAKPGESEEKVSAKEIRDLRREEYDRHIDLFQFYCGISLKANLYFYLITGGITSFYFSALSRSANSTESSGLGPLSFIEVSFLLPIFMSGVLGGVFFYGRHLWMEVVESIADIRDDLSKDGLSIKKTPEVGLLASLLLIFGSLFFLVGCALTVLVVVQMINRDVWSPDHTLDDLLRRPQSYLILLPAVLILLAGVLLPIRARRINWRLKGLRERRRRKLFKKWSAQLQEPKLDNPNHRFRDRLRSYRLKDSFLYYQLLPHLSEQTVEAIKHGEPSRSLILEDLKKLEIKWGLAPPGPSTSIQK